MLNLSNKAMLAEADKTVNLNDVRTYLENVKLRFDTKSRMYRKLLDLIKDLKSATSADSPSIMRRVSGLLERHDKQLLHEFNLFFSSTNKSDDDDLIKINMDMSASQSKVVMDELINRASQDKENFDKAVNYMSKVKFCFSNRPEIYESFLDIIETYQNQKHILTNGSPNRNVISKSEVRAQVAILFADHKDLVAELEQYLPDSNSNNQLFFKNLPQIEPQTQQFKPKSTEYSGPILRSSNVKMADLTNQNISNLKQNKKPPTKRTGVSRNSSEKENYPPSIQQSKNRIKHETIDKTPQVKSANIFSSTSNVVSASTKRQFQQTYQQENTDCKRVKMEESIEVPQTYQSNSFETSEKERIQSVLNDRVFCETLQSNPQVYVKFIQYMINYNKGFIGVQELVQLVEPLLGIHSNLNRWFRDRVMNPSIKDKVQLTPDVRLRALHDTRVDYSTCKPHGISYRDVSAYPQPFSDSQTDLCKQVLNTTLVAWAQNFRPVNSKKNIYAERLFNTEDERFELDVILETNKKTIRTLENILNAMSRMEPYQLRNLKLGDDTLGPIHLKCIQTIYGDRAKDFIEGLKENPCVAVPLVLKRLKTKDEELREGKKYLQIKWREQVGKNYLKSLDYLAVPFKQSDQKYLKFKSMLDEIQSISDQKHNERHLVFNFADLKCVLLDAGDLVVRLADQQTVFETQDKLKIRQIVHSFMPYLLFAKNDQLDEKDAHRLFYVDEHWYLFLRYYQLLCDRLHRMYDEALRIGERQRREVDNRTEEPAAELLNLRSQPKFAPDEYYPAFLDAVLSLIDGNLVNLQYENQLREIFSIHAYIAFTLDKVILNCVKQLQFLVQDQSSVSVEQYFLDEQRKNSSSSVGVDQLSQMSPRNLIKAQSAYLQRVASLHNNKHIYKIMSFKQSGLLTIELVDSQHQKQ